MQQLLLIILVSVCSGLLQNTGAAAPPLWQQLVPRKQVAADRNQDYTLTEHNGPWLVMAASFTGPEGKEQAHELIFELRSKYNLSAFYYGMTFELDDDNLGRGLDNYGAPIKRRYRKGDRKIEHAVLVGEFPRIDDPEAQKLLERVKRMSPETLQVEEGEDTAQSLATVRQFHDYLRKKIGADDKRGPMGHAFLTRNPLLPKEYFVPHGVDPEVAKWNENLEYSLMNCKGKYSIRVASFRGKTSFVKGEEPAVTQPRKAKDKDPLVIAARNAHLLTVALREKGWEAYEFHDRHESFVCVGSFDEGRTFADGSIKLPGREAQTIINTFGAHTPNNVFNRPAPQDRELEERHKQQFHNLFSKGHGQVTHGFHPKRFIGLPFDIIPEPERVPRETVSASYARQ